jgi:peroxiredoxin
MGLIPSRKTFLMDERGVIEFVYNSIFEGEGHVDAIREFINKK